jgi:hypothetical protein
VLLLVVVGLKATTYVVRTKIEAAVGAVHVTALADIVYCHILCDRLRKGLLKDFQSFRHHLRSSHQCLNVLSAAATFLVVSWTLGKRCWYYGPKCSYIPELLFLTKTDFEGQFGTFPHHQLNIYIHASQYADSVEPKAELEATLSVATA